MSLTSVVIPARNEESNIEETVFGIRRKFDECGISFEIIVVNDNSTDHTEKVVQKIHAQEPRIRVVNNVPPFGFGNAIKKGLDEFKGDYVIVAMADSSDDPDDMVRYIKEVKSGHDCCFGNRWSKGVVVENYPALKKILNRMVNGGISIIFGLHYGDVTNAFKCYSRETILGIKPILARHFNITVELPLKAIVRGYSYTVVPTHWRERRKGKTKLKLQEMGSRYLFTILYVLLEKSLTGLDYKRVKKN